MTKSERKPKIEVVVPPTPSWLRYIGLGILVDLVDQTKRIAALVGDVKDETQAMSMTVDHSQNVLKQLAKKMQNGRPRSLTKTRGRKR